jgi:hypothetical protein
VKAMEKPPSTPLAKASWFCTSVAASGIMLTRARPLCETLEDCNDRMGSDRSGAQLRQKMTLAVAGQSPGSVSALPSGANERNDGKAR